MTTKDSEVLGLLAGLEGFDVKRLYWFSAI